MNKPLEDHPELSARSAGALDFLFRPVSGLYIWKSLAPTSAAPATGLAGLFNCQTEELRLDVDGFYPQNTVSGTLKRFGDQSDWIASLSKTGGNQWSGAIWYKDGTLAWIPYTNVAVEVTMGIFGPIAATLTLSGGGVPNYTRTFLYKSRYFHKVDFEYDFATDATPATNIQTHAHPNRPAALPSEELTIRKVYQRAGFAVSESEGGAVSKALAGSGGLWNENEMHDAMQVYWSHFANAPQWAMWVFFASLSEWGASLGGIMFDDIGPHHRQGTAIFNDAFISEPPPGDAAPAAWVARMRFWTACHEMGHGFNLAHSWQKSLGAPWGSPWIPLADEPEARSFMNYPYNVEGGESAFFSDFEFRFSDQELLFLRHAPERFVQMGNAEWFDNHGFGQARVTPEPSFKLDVTCARAQSLEFMEPVVLELKLTNASRQPRIVRKHALSDASPITVIVKKRGKPARQFKAFSHPCWNPEGHVLNPGDSLSDTLFVSAGLNGWDISEPGYYTIQVALHLEKEDVISAPCTLRVAPPHGRDEEYVAQDYFSRDVGRVLAFDGSRVLDSANNTLREVADRFSNRQAATHARIALAGPLTKEYKVLNLAAAPARGLRSASDCKGAVKAIAPDGKAARELLSVLTEKPRACADTLSQIDYDYYRRRFSAVLSETGAPPAPRKGRAVPAKVGR